jgi:LAO/AO transport system kinase
LKKNSEHSQDKALQRLKAGNRLLAAAEYVEGLRKGDRSMLGRAITLVESIQPAHRELAENIIELCLPHAGNSLRIGITGVPGVGKSTFIEAFGTYLTGLGKRTAVLAIDPSSKKTGGSILGDKTRMEQLSANPLAFIRPSPSSSEMGGVARKTRETIILCEAAGFDIIIVETVGVGQSETEVKSMVDFFLLLMLAGAGDELQGIKRGIMEMADAVCITKADSGNEQAAKNARRQYRNALHMFPPAENGWIPPVELCSATMNTGLAEIWAFLTRFENEMKIKGYFHRNRQSQNLAWMHQALQGELLHRFFGNTAIQQRIPELEEQVGLGKISPFKAAELLLGSVGNHSQPGKE